LNVPAVVYVCVGFCWVDGVVLSPKFQEYVSGSLSASVAAAVKLTGSGAMPWVGVPVAEEMTGLELVGVPQPSGSTFGPSSWNQSKVPGTVVAAPLESAKKPTFGFAGRAAG